MEKPRVDPSTSSVRGLAAVSRRAGIVTGILIVGKMTTVMSPSPAVSNHQLAGAMGQFVKIKKITELSQEI